MADDENERSVIEGNDNVEGAFGISCNHWDVTKEMRRTYQDGAMVHVKREIIEDHGALQFDDVRPLKSLWTVDRADPRHERLSDHA